MHVSSVTIGFISESGRLIEILVKVTGSLSPYFPVLYFYCIKFHFAIRNPSYFTLKHVECDGRGNDLQTCIWYHQHPLPYDADVENWHRLALIPHDCLMHHALPWLSLFHRIRRRPQVLKCNNGTVRIIREPQTCTEWPQAHIETQIADIRLNREMFIPETWIWNHSVPSMVI